ncbi:hypothetical protein [Rahnella perminowiae]|uniref:hypothetical protein n=1 Tax=Rahnella perminowiae TaxID=2816244 RepID=UPI001C272D5A|nr:hypothetical protein [Rahnella perminowiae]MBU9823932.1 hypothetical protein [Rahnella perminowiae]
MDINALLVKVILTDCSLPAHPDELNPYALLLLFMCSLTFYANFFDNLQNNLIWHLGKIDIKHKYAAGEKYPQGKD